MWTELLGYLPSLSSIAIRDLDLSVRTAAVEALEAFAPDASSELCPVLLELIGPDNEASVIQGAITALMRCDERVGLRALPALTQLAEDKNQHAALRQSACQVLGRIGDAATSAVPVLAQVVLSPNPGMSKDLEELERAAAHALVQIDPKGSFLESELGLNERDKLSEQLLKCGEPEALLARNLIRRTSELRQTVRPTDQRMTLNEIVEYIFGPSPQDESEHAGWYQNNARNIHNFIKSHRLKAIQISRGLYAVDAANLDRLNTVHRGMRTSESPPRPGTGTETDRK